MDFKIKEHYLDQKQRELNLNIMEIRIQKSNQKRNYKFINTYIRSYEHLREYIKQG
ncbi:unnamed protein product [Paramecium sonneborni]|uniref:Uncharacterized protein n=1 Tax=Paramecium sonneborni TaxID=65129 RepID=A0A8S1K1I6_9CILI|nr:unnamed protein product [Paramecium sonneborni]